MVTFLERIQSLEASAGFNLLNWLSKQRLGGDDLYDQVESVINLCSISPIEPIL